MGERALNLKDIQDMLQAKVLTCVNKDDLVVNCVKASDLMSDVLASCEKDDLLITGLSNMQTIRTAEVVDIGAIVFVRGKQPSEQMIQIAENSSIPLLSTKPLMFEACGILYPHYYK